MIVAVDPGHANCAYTVMDPNTYEIQECGVHRVSIPHTTTDAEISAACVEIMVDLCSRHTIDSFVVEFQGMGRAMTVVESSFMTAALCCGVSRVSSIHPMTIKAYFKDLGCRGNKQNKKDAEALVVKLGYQNYVSHIADCILMTLCVLQAKI